MIDSTERTGVSLFTEYNVAANLRAQVARRLFDAKDEVSRLEEFSPHRPSKLGRAQLLKQAMAEVVVLEAELIRTHELAQIAWWDLGRPLRPL